MKRLGQVAGDKSQAAEMNGAANGVQRITDHGSRITHHLLRRRRQRHDRRRTRSQTQYEYWAPKTQPLGTGGDTHFAFRTPSTLRWSA
ncbi:MAG: hypothetical protein R2873_16235 [Caldilineaceae bacterium]